MIFRLNPRYAITSCFIAAILAAFSIQSTARGEFLGPTIRITAVDADGIRASREWTVPNLPEKASERARFELAERISLVSDSGKVLGTVNDLGAFLDGDPVVDLDFSVTAGSTPTTFTITSALVGFPVINNPIAFATAAVTVTDGASLPGNGAQLLAGSNPNLYQARYNGGSVFADLLGTVTRTGAGSASMSADTGITNIPGAVTSIQGEFSFKLSGGDLASGTSHYEVVPVPEPATAGLVFAGIVGLMMARRRS